MASSLKVRDSNFELLRLLCIFMIVFYHLLDYYVYPQTHFLIYRTLWIPLHVAVVCFVLISGYYHIQLKKAGVVKLLMPLIFFYLPGEIIKVILGQIMIKDFVMGILYPPYWYIRVYFYLYLFSPVINKYIDNSTLRNRWYILFTLFFVCVYMGILGDESLKDGKNLVFFIFLYFVGDIIHAYVDKISRISTWKLLFLYIMGNILLMFAYYNFFGSIISKLIWKFSYPYNSPILVANATLLFLLFGKFKFKSSIINSLAASVLSIYVLHQEYFVFNYLIIPSMREILLRFTNSIIVILCLAVLTIIIIIISVLLDKIFSPICKMCLKRVENY